MTSKDKQQGQQKGRSLREIGDDDLAHLARIARRDREQFFEGHPEFEDRVLAVALCQGAGSHYVEKALGSSERTGIKDFDVWTFFALQPGSRFPADRRNTHVDLGPTKFGKWPHEDPRFQHFTGRRVDLLMRGLPVTSDADPIEAIRAWLAEGRTKSAALLAEKGVVLIDPPQYRSRIIWPLRLSLVVR